MKGNRHNPEEIAITGGGSIVWRSWIGALLIAGALSIYVLSGDPAWVPHATGFPETAVKQIWMEVETTSCF
jgi:hypothetical protein